MKGLRLTSGGLSLVALLVLGDRTSALAEDPPPSVQQIRSAAAEYDAGRRAYVDKDYEGAAVHFENAFHDAPSAEALRNAIRSRRKASQLARAATLAELASLKYPKDAPTGVIVRETLSESQSKLDRVTLACSPECSVAADGRAISLADAAQTIFFLEPGSHDLVVSWSSDRTKIQKIVARAGGHDELTLEAPSSASSTPPPSIASVSPLAPPVLVPQENQVDALAEPSRTKPLGPAVFIALAAITAGGVGFTVWSGIDAENNPGTSAVKTECAGMGVNCPAYQKGLSAQLRTNVALGATGGVALATALVGIFFTQWSNPKSKRAPLALEPTGAVQAGGATLGLRGSF